MWGDSLILTTDNDDDDADDDDDIDNNDSTIVIQSYDDDGNDVKTVVLVSVSLLNTGRALGPSIFNAKKSLLKTDSS